MLTAPHMVLDAAGISYEVRRHSRDVFTVEEAAQERGVRVSQIVKVMIVRRSCGELLAVLVPGDRRLSLSKLRHTLGQSRLRLASPEEIEAFTGATVGAISPLGLHEIVPTYIDYRIGDRGDIAISSGDPRSGLVLAAQDLLHLVGGVIGDFC